MATTGIPHPLSGDPDFFATIRDRPEFKAGLGSFWGVDNELHYVVMDATFYRLGVFDRGGWGSTSGTNFHASVDALMTRDTAIRALVNGQFFGGDEFYPDPIRGIPPVGLPSGGFIAEGRYEPGRAESDYVTVEQSFLYFYTLGQLRGCGQESYEIYAGRPGPLQAVLSNAMGGLLRFIKDGIVGAEAEWAEPQGPGYELDEGISKTCVGIHRPSNCVFAMADLSCRSIVRLQRQLLAMGVAEAVLLDCSASTAMSVRDGPDLNTLPIIDPTRYCTEVIQCTLLHWAVRDYTIPNALYFRYSAPTVDGIFLFEQADPAFSRPDAHHLLPYRVAAVDGGLAGSLVLFPDLYQLLITTLGSPVADMSETLRAGREALRAALAADPHLRAPHPSADDDLLVFTGTGSARAELRLHDSGSHLRGVIVLAAEGSPAMTLNVIFNLR